MQSNEQILEIAASGGAIESDTWPRVREYLLARIDEIVSSEFPPPPPSLSRTRPTALNTQSSIETTTTQQSTTSADKENAPPPPLLDNTVPIDAFGQPKLARSPLDTAEALHKDIRTTLKDGFPEHPPHTIQRVAELVLRPKREYRYLPPYLQALNRAVSVTSNTSAFPLPYSSVNATTGTTGLLVNGHHDSSLGSDESLGGALLTPIPWLTAHSPASATDHELRDTAHRLQEQHAMDSDHLTDSSEAHSLESGHISGEELNGVEREISSPDRSLDARLRSEGAVSQGELLRLEQQAGVTPIPTRPLSEDESMPPEIDETSAINNLDADEVPHARGPDEIGVEDTGPQTGTGGVAGIVRSAETKPAEPVVASEGDTTDKPSDSAIMDLDEKTESSKSGES